LHYLLSCTFSFSSSFHHILLSSSFYFIYYLFLSCSFCPLLRIIVCVSLLLRSKRTTMRIKG
jgi:hypothetical protein